MTRLHVRQGMTLLREPVQPARPAPHGDRDRRRQHRRDRRVIGMMPVRRCVLAKLRRLR